MTLKKAKSVAINTNKHSPNVIRKALFELISVLALHNETTHKNTTREIERRIMLCRTALAA